MQSFGRYARAGLYCARLLDFPGSAGHLREIMALSDLDGSGLWVVFGGVFLGFLGRVRCEAV